jgi:uncharacterized protein YxeA
MSRTKIIVLVSTILILIATGCFLFLKKYSTIFADTNNTWTYNQSSTSNQGAAEIDHSYNGTTWAYDYKASGYLYTANNTGQLFELNPSSPNSGGSGIYLFITTQNGSYYANGLYAGKLAGKTSLSGAYFYSPAPPATYYQLSGLINQSDIQDLTKNDSTAVQQYMLAFATNNTLSSYPVQITNVSANYGSAAQNCSAPTRIDLTQPLPDDINQYVQAWEKVTGGKIPSTVNGNDNNAAFTALTGSAIYSTATNSTGCTGPAYNFLTAAGSNLNSSFIDLKNNPQLPSALKNCLANILPIAIATCAGLATGYTKAISSVSSAQQTAIMQWALAAHYATAQANYLSCIQQNSTDSTIKAHAQQEYNCVTKAEGDTNQTTQTINNLPSDQNTLAGQLASTFQGYITQIMQKAMNFVWGIVNSAPL